MTKTYGYARVSTEDQELGLQVSALREAGVPEKHIVREKASGRAGADRPLYAALLDRLQDGDRLVVWKVDRLGRSTLDALQTAKALDDRGVSIVITTLGIDLKTPAGRLVFGVMCQIAEFEHTLIRDRVIAGIADAKARGKPHGRRHTLTPHQRAEAVRLHADGKSFGVIADLFGCSRSVVFRAVQGPNNILARAQNPQTAAGSYGNNTSPELQKKLLRGQHPQTAAGLYKSRVTNPGPRDG